MFFQTGWDKHFEDEEKYNNHPEVGMEVIKYLVAKKVNMIGIDTLGLGKKVFPQEHLRGGLPIGSGFLRGMQMLVVSLVLCSLVCGAMSIGDSKKLGNFFVPI